MATEMDGATIRSLHDQRPEFFEGIALFLLLVEGIGGGARDTSHWRAIWQGNALVVLVFLFGYMASLANGRTQRRQGALVAAALIGRRIWKLYVAYIVLLVVLTAEVSGLALWSQNPAYMDEMGLADVAAAPHIAFIKALLLSFQPYSIAILPLLIVLLALLPLALQAIMRNRLLTLIAALLLYAAGQLWWLPDGPTGRMWRYDPFTWQLPFVIGALCGYRALSARVVPPRLSVAVGALAVLTLCIAATLFLLGHPATSTPMAALRAIGLDRADLGLLRIVSVLALMILIAGSFPPESQFLRVCWLHPITLCGRHASYVLCVAILMGAFGRIALTELHGRAPLQLGFCVLGIATMVATGLLLDWFERVGSITSPRVPPRIPASHRSKHKPGDGGAAPNLPKAA